MLALVLVIQIVTGVLLAMHYQPSVAMAFASVEHGTSPVPPVGLGLELSCEDEAGYSLPHSL